MSPRARRQDLLTRSLLPRAALERIAEDAILLPGAASHEAPALLAAVQEVVTLAPWRHMLTPGGARMSVAMTNCGQVGWTSDRRGYRYAPIDPDSGPFEYGLRAPFAHRAFAPNVWPRALTDRVMGP